MGSKTYKELIHGNFIFSALLEILRMFSCCYYSWHELSYLARFSGNMFASTVMLGFSLKAEHAMHQQMGDFG
jgi:hypothetical protein